MSIWVVMRSVWIVGKSCDDRFFADQGFTIFDPFRQSNPTIKNFVMTKLGGNYRKLESYFIERLTKIVASFPTKNGYVGE